jgi:hypothetical protein
MENKYTIYLDFDGTCVEHDYPNIGRYNPHSLNVIKRLIDSGHDIILNTYRVEINHTALMQALNWFSNAWHFLDDDSIDINITRYTEYKVYPHTYDLNQIKESKIIYIDDIANKIPLIKAKMVNGLMVDWKTIESDLESIGVI